MSNISFTDEQRRAIGILGKSVVVSAAAGAGKTAVLAERCAYLVCDAPPSQRCNADELLVLTFTEAAAAEMRMRIIQAIRSRLEAPAHDARLSEQVSLVEASQISTIHAFCLWLIRRWFSHAGVDPTATVLSADEAALLKSEVLQGLFARLYGSCNASDGHPQSPRTNLANSLPEEEPAITTLAPEFQRLVDDYGLGDDREVSRLVLRLYDFLCSLPDSESWLRTACESLEDHPERVVAAMALDLRRELRRQAEHCGPLADAVASSGDIALFYADQIRAYADQVRAWERALHALPGEGHIDSTDRLGDGDAGKIIARFDVVRKEVAELQFASARAPRLSRDAPSTLHAVRDAAREQLAWVKNTLFQTRLKEGFALFPVEELVAGLHRIAPYVRTIAEVVRSFRAAYARRKRELAVMDFADLERFAFELLSGGDADAGGSDVARAVRRRFAHVLVDEFQDINPIQEAIVRLASREADRIAGNNLFVVGDVKQSIYRFRLAEPAIFAARLKEAQQRREDHEVVFLQRNFRSRPQILEAVNLVFRQLMREGAAGVVYEAEAELRPGRVDDAAEPHPAVEVHLLERSGKGAFVEDESAEAHLEQGVADPFSSKRWAPEEREAYVIASRIREWVRSGRLRADGASLHYRDVAVLLRNARITAERVAGMLSLLGIPAFADVGGSLFGAREIRDVLAALTLLDNAQQDIPLAAVLRNGMLSEPFSDDELVEMRCLSRDVPFHAAVRRYAVDGPDAGLRRRAAYFWRHVAHFREEIRRRLLADVIWRLYEHRGYLAYACGLPNGAQRRANLLKLHELARQFGTFRRQGLHRFLRFVASLDEEERTVAAAAPLGEAEDVVRVMTIHQAKGLEFPVVFVAGLGTKFNLRDRSGRMIFERKNRIGLRVVDTEQLVEFPSAAHTRVADEIEQAAREEEVRILYVAMTRAREKLALVGSMHNVMGCRTDSTHQRSAGRSVEPALSSLTFATANSPLDWLVPALQCAPPGLVGGLGGSNVDVPLIDVQTYDWDQMRNWSAGRSSHDRRNALHEAIARFNPLWAEEPRSPDDPTVHDVLTRLDSMYPHLPSASVRAAVAASGFEDVYDDSMRNPEERPRLSSQADFEIPPSRYAPMDADDPRHRGTVTHLALQYLNFEMAKDARGLAAELERLVAEGLISPVDATIVDRDSLAWFVATPLAAAIRRAGPRYRRELTYTAAEPLEFFDPGIGPADGDHVLVRGMVDGILPVEGGIELVDYKTDVIPASQVAERAERYRPQMALYARAMSRLWGCPVQTGWLVFLAARHCHALGVDALVVNQNASENVR